MKKRWSLFLACGLLAWCPCSVAADGAYFSHPAVASFAVSSDQRAIVVRNGGITTVTMSTAYTGDSEDFAWIIPTPAAPSAGDVIQAGEIGEKAFAILDGRTAPRIQFSSTLGARGSDVGTVEESKRVKEPQQVQVRAQFLLASYEVSILDASSSAPLVAWLKGNGYSVAPAAQSVLAEYVARNWTFVAIKLRPADKRRYSNEFLPPVTIRYRSDQFVFPLRISGVSTIQPAKITLFVIARSTIRSSNFVTRKVAREWRGGLNPEENIEAAISEAAGTDGKAVAVLWSGRYISPDLDGLEESILGEWLVIEYSMEDYLASMQGKDFLKSPIYLTRLEVRMHPPTVLEDIAFTEEETPQEFSLSFRGD